MLADLFTDLGSSEVSDDGRMGAGVGWGDKRRGADSIVDICVDWSFPSCIFYFARVNGTR